MLPEKLESALPGAAGTLYGLLSRGLESREPSIRSRIAELRAAHSELTSDELANQLIQETRRKIAGSGAMAGAASAFPGVGTLLAMGMVGSQTLFALERELEMVLGIAIIYGRELSGSDDRLKEALVVAGIGAGVVKLEEKVLVVGSQRIALAAFRRLPEMMLRVGGERLLGRLLSRLAMSGAMRGAGRLIPFAVGIAVGAGADYVAVTAMGKAAIRYYRQAEKA